MAAAESIIYGIIGFASVYLILDIIEKARGKRFVKSKSNEYWKNSYLLFIKIIIDLPSFLRDFFKKTKSPGSRFEEAFK